MKTNSRMLVILTILVLLVSSCSLFGTQSISPTQKPDASQPGQGCFCFIPAAICAICFHPRPAPGEISIRLHAACRPVISGWVGLP